MSRQQSDVGSAILGVIVSAATAREVATRLQLSRRLATVHLARMVSRDPPLAEVVGERREDGVDRPVPVYRQIAVVAAPQTSILEALNEAIRARQRRIERKSNP